MAKLAKLPFPYYGGKSRAAAEVWKRFGTVRNFVEPFCGGCGVLLNRPQPFEGLETINDLNGFITNFWRASQESPNEVAFWCNWPVNELDLAARHKWLLDQAPGLEEKLVNDPCWYDAKVAGWWAWGQCQWIGGGWCAGRSWRQMPDVSDAGHGVCRPGIGQAGKLPYLSSQAQGVNCLAGIKRRPSDDFKGVNRTSEDDLVSYFNELAARLRRVRVCCGDWSRVVTTCNTTRHGLTAVFLDPPYSAKANRKEKIYRRDSLEVANEAREWAIANGNNPLFRIAFCGYEAEHDMPDNWSCWEWKSGGSKKNGHRERIWFSTWCNNDKTQA